MSWHALFLVAALAPSVGLAAGEKHGLFWYETPTKKEEAQKKKTYPRPVVPDAKTLFDMHPRELKKLLDETLQYAVYKLTPESTLDYYKVKDAMRRKSAAFTSLSGYVMLEKPELNAAQDYPVTNPGTAEKRRQLDDMVSKQLAGQRRNFALLFFSQPNCPYCIQQSYVLENLQREFGWIIKEIDIVHNPNAAAKFNVQRTPVTILIKNGSKKWMPVSVGVDSLTNIKFNLYRMTRILSGKVDPRQFYLNEQQEGGFFDPLKTDMKL